MPRCSVSRSRCSTGGSVRLYALPGMARCSAPLRSVFAGTSFGPPRQRLISTITGGLVTAEDDMARLLAGQVTRPVLFAQAMAQAAAGRRPDRDGRTRA